MNNILCYERNNIIFNYITIIIIIINLFYWYFMETYVRKEESKVIGSNKSKLVQKEYKNTSRIIVISILCLYFIPIIIKEFNIHLFIIQEYNNCNVSLFSLYFIIPIIISLSSIYLRYWAMETLGVYFSRKLVVQGQQNIINEGPYSYVRHPGYAANVLMFLCYSIVVSGDFFIGLLIWGQYMIVLLTIRIPNEEEMLLSNSVTSDGYKKYKTIVKYRIIPFIV